MMDGSEEGQVKERKSFRGRAGRGRPRGRGPPAAIPMAGDANADDDPAAEAEDQKFEFADHEALVGAPKRKGQQPKSLIHQVFSLSLAMLLRNAGSIPEVAHRAFTLATCLCSFRSLVFF